MADPLFRPEVLDAQRRSWLGGISLAQPLPLWGLTAGALVAALAVVALLVFGSYTRRVTVYGQLVPEKGMATVLAPATGVLADLRVAEGDRVADGEMLALIRVPRATADGSEIVAALEQRLQRRVQSVEDTHQSREQLTAIQAKGLQDQLRSARLELAQIEEEIGTRKQQVRLAQESLARMRELEGERYVSALQVEQQEAAALGHVGDMQMLQRQAISSRRTIAQLEQSLRELPEQKLASLATLTNDRALIEQEQLENQARSALTISAPIPSIVAVQLAKSGQSVQAGQPLFQLLPGESALEAQLMVPSRSIGFIEPGDTVLLRYEAYPYQKFGHHRGQVASISRSALAPGEPQPGWGDQVFGEPMYRVTVRLAGQSITAYGKDEALKPGMALQADVMGERRKLFEWILEPLYSLWGKA